MRFVIILLLKFYKRWISPVLPMACRFHPTCSEYSIQAFNKHGFIKGFYYSFLRVLRCHPFHPGGFDPVP